MTSMRRVVLLVSVAAAIALSSAGGLAERKTTVGSTRPAGTSEQIERARRRPLPSYFSPSQRRARLQAATQQAVPADFTVGQPWFGENAIVETVEEIMERERLAPKPKPGTVRETKPERPARPRNLPQAPGAMPVAEWPPRAAASNPAPETAPPTLPQAVGTSFLGIQSSESGFIPPDSMGDVGPSQVLVVANGRIKVFDKAGNLGGLNASTDTFFNSVRSASTSDPHIRYDRLSGRWFIAIIDVASASNRILIAASSGPTITSASSFSFFGFAHDAAGPTPNPDTGQFADYPTLGVDSRALYIGVNEFGGSFPYPFLHCSVYVVNKADLVSGTLTVTPFRDVTAGQSTGPFTPQGVHNDDPAAAEGYFIGVDIASFSKLDIRRVINPGGTPSLSGNLFVTVPTTTFPIDQPAQGSTKPLDAIDDRLFAAMMMKNKLTGSSSLWTAHNIEVNSSGVGSIGGGRNGSRWYEITNLNGTPALGQAGTLFDSASSNPLGYWMSSVALSGQGHMAMGTSVAGPTSFAGIVAAGRLASDALGAIQAPTVALASSTSYNAGGGFSYRWGDYSQVVIDPNDNMTMWTFQEYCNATNSWGVRAIQLRAPPPATPTSASPPSVDAGQPSVNVTITGSSTAGSAFFDPGSDPGGPGFANHIAASIPGVAVNSVTFVDPTHVMLNISTVGASAGAKNITVTNPDGQARTGNGLLTIVAVNTPPTISNISDQTFVHDAPTSPIPFTVGDVETAAGSLTVSGTSSNPTLVPNANLSFGGSGANRTLTITPAASQTGKTTITVTVQDGGGLTASDTFVLTIAPGSVPTISNVADAATNEDTPTSAMPFTVGDAETAAGALTLSGTSSNTLLVPVSGIVFGGSGANRTVTITPAANESGTSTIGITVQDADGLTASDTFILTVNAVNDPPTISDIADTSANEDVSTPALAFTIGDIETAPSSLTLSGSSSNTTLVPNANIVFGGSGANRTVQVTPALNQSGSTTITVTVNDGAATANDAFVLTVNPVNDAPTISNLTDQAISEDASFGPAGFTVNDVDTPLTSLTLSAASSNTTLVPVASIVFGGSDGSRTIAVTPAPNKTGFSVITVTVSDGSLTAADSFVLTVNQVNDAPTISDIGDQTIPQDTRTAPLNFTVGDIETPAGILTVSGISSNPALVPNGNAFYIDFGGSGASRTVRVRPVAGTTGQTTITVTVSDGSLTAADTFLLTVTPPAGNTPPTITDIADQAIVQDTRTAPLAFTVGDAQTPAGSLVVTGSSSNPALVPNGSTFYIDFGGTGSSRTIRVRPLAGQTGQTTITVAVSDGSLTATDTFLLTVTPPGGGNTPPTANNDVYGTPMNTPLSVAAPGVLANDTDTDGDPLTAVLGSGPTHGSLTTPLGANGSFTYTPNASFTGADSFTYRASDGVATSNLATVTINVTGGGGNTPPTISDITDQSIVQDTRTAPLPFTIGDAQTPAGSLTVSAVSSNPALVPNGNAFYIDFGGTGSSRTIRVRPVAGMTGQTTITVTVSDGSLTASDAFIVTVTPVGGNTPPTISDIADQTIVVNTRTAPLPFTVGDAETAAGSLAVSAVSSNTALVPNGNAFYVDFGGTGSSRTIRVRPVGGMTGQTTITVTVSDGSLTATDTFVLTVTP